MNKYQVRIARTEATMYTFEVKAKNYKQAEEKAMEAFGQGEEPDDEDIVWGEEEVHEVNLIEGEEPEEE